MRVKSGKASRLTLLFSLAIGACTSPSIEPLPGLGVHVSELPAYDPEGDFPDDPPDPGDVPIDEPGPVVGEVDDVIDVSSTCPISWRPNAFAPVFYGFRDYDAAQGAPVAMRVFFPTLDGSPQNADILGGCGRYPVVVFAHGQCLTDANHHQRWLQLPAQLARSGYVVIVPALPAMSTAPSPSHPALLAMDGALQWVRQTWVHHAHVMPTTVGVAGHSYGGLLAAEFARTRTVNGYAAVGADWHSWSGTLPVNGINKPKLVLWGGLEPFSQLSTGQFDALSYPKHRAVFTEGEHWDYLPAGQSSCHPNAGTCTLIPSASADLLTMFFGKHMPPELAPELPSRIPANLYPPPLSLTFEQQFYAGGHLIGMRAMAGTPGCGFALTAQMAPPPPPPPPPTLRTVPYVRELGSSAARALVLDAGLKPAFKGTGTWVYSQSPSAGTQVLSGSTVTMTLRSGPIP